MTEGSPLVVTGRGAVSAVGSDVGSLWHAHVAGRSGVRLEDRVATAGLPCGFATAHLPAAEQARLRAQWAPPAASLADAYLCEVVHQAMAEAGLSAATPGRVTVVAGLETPETGGAPEDFELVREAAARGAAAGTTERGGAAAFYREQGVPPSFAIVPGFAVELAGTLRRAVRTLLCDAICATGLRVVAEAARELLLDRADVAIAAAASSRITPYALGGNAQLAALSRWRDPADEASKPFDRRRDGMVPGEGAGALVLERADRAMARGARPLAQLGGWAFRTRAGHPTQTVDAKVAEVMRAALAAAGCPPDAIDAVSTHGTSTQLNDRSEARAIHDIFGSRTRSLGITAAKSVLGHTWAAAGILELVSAVEMLRAGLVPPIASCREPDPECDLPIERAAVRRPLRALLKSSFGFGGQYGSLVLLRSEG